MNRLALFALAGVALGACASPHHLGYDFGRSITAVAALQSDLTRPSVAAGGHPLNGVEAEAIRMQVSETSSDAESGVSTMTDG